MVLFAVSVGCRNIWSGPEDRHCKVHNGLTLITRPSPRRAIACTLALGRCVLAYLTSFDELRCHGRRGPADYIGQNLFRTLWQRGLHLITGIRRNMRNYLMPLADKIMLRKRFVIETVLDTLKSEMGLEHSRHRSPVNAMVHVLS